MARFIISAAILALSWAPALAQETPPGPEEAAEMLVSTAPASRLKAIYALAAARDDASAEILCLHLKSEKDAYLRAQAAESFDVLASTWAYRCSLEAMDDPNPAVRQAAVASLSRANAAPEAADRLERAASSDASAAVRLAALHSFFVHRTTSSVRVIDAALADQAAPAGLRRAAAAALEKFGTPESRAALQKHANDKDPEVKAAVQRQRRARGR